MIAVISTFCTDNRPVAPEDLPGDFDTIDAAKADVDRAIAQMPGSPVFSAWREQFGVWYREGATYGFSVREVSEAR